MPKALEFGVCKTFKLSKTIPSFYFWQLSFEVYFKHQKSDLQNNWLSFFYSRFCVRVSIVLEEICGVVWAALQWQTKLFTKG